MVAARAAAALPCFGQYIFGAERVAVTRVALHPADRRRCLQRAREAVARQPQPVDQFDEASPLCAARSASSGTSQRWLPSRTSKGSGMVDGICN